ncbi:hypothetical protein [Amycolatopsis sp. DSM 110486]|uniref:hypothetical protein n=1 Tax=Amycolatopsis sp. DSM 110486 TaxID=2865832 RepID=UPI001C6A4069|nr:hypothetical protein [Amycolatopsis sp. DSM 110486]QYN18929.1 hypothetical protein K1T34_40580 [Amycolatopsis sp. DSM 110486]
MTSDGFLGQNLPDEVYGGSLTAFFGHGILVLEDVSSEAHHSSWDPDVEALHLDADSLYVEVGASVVGPVRVDLFVDEPPEIFVDGLIVRLQTVLETPSLTVRIRDSDDQASMKVDVLGGVQDMTVYTNGSDWVDRVVIVLIAR